MFVFIYYDNKCYGVVVRDLIIGEILVYVFKGMFLVIGGYGCVYKYIINVVICDGVGVVSVLEIGVVKLGNMEVV